MAKNILISTREGSLATRSGIRLRGSKPDLPDGSRRGLVVECPEVRGRDLQNIIATKVITG